MTTNFEFSPVILSVILGAFTSLLFSYIPGLNTWYASQKEEFKKLFMLGILFLITASIYALACFNILFPDGFVCGTKSLIDFVFIFLTTIMGNQGTFKITPTANKVADVNFEKYFAEKMQAWKEMSDKENTQ